MNLLSSPTRNPWMAWWMSKDTSDTTSGHGKLPVVRPGHGLNRAALLLSVPFGYLLARNCRILISFVFGTANHTQSLHQLWCCAGWLVRSRTILSDFTTRPNRQGSESRRLCRA